MKNLAIPMVIRIFALMGLLPVLAADLKTFKEAYQKSSDEILQSANPQFADLQQQYKKALETMKSTVQSQGDLVKTKAVIAEIDRFQKEKSQPATLNENELKEIKAYQIAYMKQYAKLETDLTMKLGALMIKYEQDLDLLQKEMVKTGKLDEATAIFAEREKAQLTIKGYTDQLAALRDSPATNRTSMTTASAMPSRPVLGVSGTSADKMDLYLVVDLKGGADATNYPVSYLVDEPKSGWTDEYKTDKLVLRRIEPGNFFMGSPHDGMVKKLGETRRKVTLNQAFYIGVFEVTQRQWELVMGNRPSFFSNSAYYATLPVEQVSYLDIRGSGDGANWPAYNNVDATSFMGKMRAQTGNAFDLPTEAQWEYAGRAGTLSSTASSTASIYESKGDKDKMAWYKDTASGKTHPVGQKKANAWGLYDIRGNVWEWCLDWVEDSSSAVSDPRGAPAGYFRMVRGCSWLDTENYCRIACRNCYEPDYRYRHVGFRVALPIGQQ